LLRRVERQPLFELRSDGGMAQKRRLGNRASRDRDRFVKPAFGCVGRRQRVQRRQVAAGRQPDGAFGQRNRVVRVAQRRVRGRRANPGQTAQRLRLVWPERQRRLELTNGLGPAAFAGQQVRQVDVRLDVVGPERGRALIVFARLRGAA
jgi:hypothetical protein